MTGVAAADDLSTIIYAIPWITKGQTEFQILCSVESTLILIQMSDVPTEN